LSFTDSDQFKELVRTRTDIVSLIGESVGLQAQRGGREFVGLCPFHDDHRPSMRVNPERQSFKCWACGTGGDCYTFVMERDRLTFPEALELLANRVGLEMPKHAVENRDQGITKQRLHEVLGWAEAEFHRCLVNDPMGDVARQYLVSRGFLPETIQRFRLGYHPNDWQWLMDRSRGRYKVEELEAAKLVGAKDSGGYYDYFVDRVMFPIRDMQGRTVAFGGRILPQAGGSDRAKYWNSPESSIFSKSHLLYGLEMARDGFKRVNRAVVVEGYTDCILAHQAGLDHVVGTLGTALTNEHVSVLKRFVREVVLIYDGDTAGQNASDRSLPRFLAQEVDLRIMTLPDDLDPADALQLHGLEWFENLLKHAPEVWQYKFRRLVSKYGLTSIDARHRVLEEMLETISLVPVRMGNMLAGSWGMRETLILGQLAKDLGIPERTVRDRLQEIRRKKKQDDERRGTTRIDAGQQNRTNRYSQLLKSPTRIVRLECDLLSVMLAHPYTVERFISELGTGQVSHPDLARLLQIIYNLYERGITPGFDQVLLELDADDLKPLVVTLMEHAERSNMSAGLAEQLLAVLHIEKESLEDKESLVEKEIQGEPDAEVLSGDPFDANGFEGGSQDDEPTDGEGFRRERLDTIQGMSEPVPAPKSALQIAAERAAAKEAAYKQLKTTWNNVTR